MRHSLRLLTGIILVGLALIPHIVVAGSIEVAPTTITLPAAASSTVIHLTNRGPDAVFAQIESFDWSQINMRDQLTPSNLLQVSPPMVHLMPGQQQTVRVVMGTDNNAKEEHAYRLSISELPDPAARKSGIQVLLQFLVPVFIKGTENSAHRLTWRAVQIDDNIILTGTNAGTRHLKLSSLSVTNRNGEEIAVSGQAFTYLLQGSSHQWKIAAEKIEPGQAITIQAYDETDGILKGSYVVEK